MKFTLFLFLSCLYFSTSFAQVSQNSPETNSVVFRERLDEQKLNYKVPKGYEQLYRSYNAMMGTILLSGSEHQLRALKDSVFIYFAIIPIDTTTAYINKMKKFGFRPKINVNYLQTSSDTLKYPITRNAPGVTRKKIQR